MTPAAPRRTRAATALLVAVTAVWGSTFFLIHDLVRSVPPEDFLGVRFAIAAVVMVVVFRRQVWALDAKAVRTGLLLGALYAVAQLLQTIGLAHTPASRSGFLTALYVVMTPLLSAAVLRRRVGAHTWVAVALAIGGSAVLSLGSLGFGLGETLTVLSAVVYALHIIWLGSATSEQDAAGLSAVQMVGIAAVCLVAALPGGVTTPSTIGGWSSLLYMTLVSGALAMWAQTWAQTQLPAERTAVVMTTEPVFAAGFAVAFGGESLTWRMLAGGGLVLAAMYVVELADRRPVPDPELLHHEGA